MGILEVLSLPAMKGLPAPKNTKRRNLRRGDDKSGGGGEDAQTPGHHSCIRSHARSTRTSNLSPATLKPLSNHADISAPQPIHPGCKHSTLGVARRRPTGRGRCFCRDGSRTQSVAVEGASEGRVLCRVLYPKAHVN